MTLPLPEDLPATIPNQRVRTLKARHVSMIAFGGVIGAGLFVGSSAAIAQTGPAVLLALIGTGVLVVLVMRMLGEMLLARPGLGSFVDYVRAGNGAWAGFLAGWLYWFFWIVAAGSEAIGGAILLHDWVALPTWTLAIGLIFMVLAVNTISAHFFGECEFWLSLAKVTCLIGFSFAGILYLSHIFGPGAPAAHNLLDHGGLVPHGWASVIAVVPTILFSMIGSEAATVAAAETENAERNVERTTRSVGLRITLFYVASIALILCIVPWSSIVPGQSPFVAAMEAMGIPGAGLLIRIIVLSAIISCLNSAVYITSRTLHGLAENGEAPAYFATLSSRHVPSRAILASCIAAVMIAFSSILSPNTLFAFLLGASGAVMIFVYMLIIRAHLIMRRQFAAQGPLPRAFKLGPAPALHYLATGALTVVIIAMLLSVSQRMTVLTSLGTAGFILGVYFAIFRKKTTVVDALKMDQTGASIP